MNQKTYILCFLSSFALATVLVPLVERFARRRSLMERPNPRKPQAGTLHPLAGGLAVFIAMWLPIALLHLHDNRIVERLRAERDELLALVLAGLGATLLGLYDDARGANARQKLTVQVAIALALFEFGHVRISVLHVPALGEVRFATPLSLFVTTLWIVGITNALNLVDGIDGLAAGVALFAALAAGFVNGIAGDPLLAVTMLSLGGALVGFLRYNFHPARIFLGDTGSMFLGMTLAVASVATCTKRAVAISVFVPFAILAYPILDTAAAIVRRHLRGRPFWSSDRQHIHHRLLARGLTASGAALTIYSVSVLFAVLAVGIVLENTPAVVIAALAAAAMLMVGVRRLGLQDLLARCSLAERRQLQRVRALVDFYVLKLGEEPASIGALLDEAAREADAKITLVAIAGAPPPGCDLVSASARHALVAEFVPGKTPVYREEALAQLMRLAWHGRAIEFLVAGTGPVLPDDRAMTPQSGFSIWKM